jgi:hypothetical protein
MDTRARNYPANYCLQQRDNKLSKNYTLYEHGAMGTPVNPAIPTLGYTPSHMNSNVFSNNPIEIESVLFGINANNLVDPQKPVNPELKSIQFKSFFERLPLIMPNPLILDSNQRPFPVP